MDSVYVDGLVQDCSYSIASTVDLLQFYTKPSMWSSSWIVPDDMIRMGTYRVD